jgi:hypothetical protein
MCVRVKSNTSLTIFFFCPDRLSSENLSPATATRPRERGPTFLSRTFHSPALFCVGWASRKKARSQEDRLIFKYYFQISPQEARERTTARCV